MQPFLPLLSILIKYPFLKFSKVFIESEYKNKDLLEILSLKGSIEKEAVNLGKDIVISNLSNEKGKRTRLEYPQIDYICLVCEEKPCRVFCVNNAIDTQRDWNKCKFCGECFKNCKAEIAVESYLDLKIKAKKIILAYLFSRLLVACLDEKLRRKYAIKEARKYAKLLEKENEEILKLVIADFGLNAIVANGNFKIHLVDYLKAFVKIRAEKWRIVNRNINNGYVSLSKKEFVRVIEEYIRKKLKEKLELSKDVKDMLMTYLSGIKIPKAYREFQVIKERKIKVELFPPCMKKILMDLRNGLNVPHSARFALTAFLLNLGMKVEEIFEIFKTAPDFDEEKARYQIEHIAGLRGKGTEYICPSCETMRTYHNCYPDNSCRNISHPLVYYKKNVLKYEEKKNKKQKKNENR